MKNSGIIITKELFPAERCDMIIDVYERTTKTNPSWVYFGDNNTNRTDSAMCFDEIADFRGRPQERLVQEVNEHLTKALYEYFDYYPVLKSPVSGLYSVRQKLQKTPISGGFHQWHYENGRPSQSPRMLAWTIYLNDVEEGGETEFLYQSERVKSVKGRTLIFPAGFMHTHRGNPPISNEKYILTGWFNLRMDDNFFESNMY
jgi:hypothetical protein